VANCLMTKEDLEGAIEDAIEWLEENDDATAEEIKEQQKELEAIARPIVSAHMQQQQQPGDGSDQYSDDDFEDHDEL